MNEEAPSEFRLILRELPRKRVALVLVVVLVDMCVAYYRGLTISHQRLLAEMAASRARTAAMGGRSGGVIFVDMGRPVPPWEWTADEWRESVWPWK